MSILYFGADGMYSIGAGMVSPKEAIIAPEVPAPETLREVGSAHRATAMTVEFGDGYGRAYDQPVTEETTRIVVSVPGRRR